MMDAEPRIGEYMTPHPYSIEAGEKLARAAEMMTQHRIRHLPVLVNGVPSGLISDRDIRMAAAVHSTQRDLLTVRDVYVNNPYTCTPETLLRTVARDMANDHLGSALVVENGRLVGIFTTVDACRALARLI